MDMNGNIGGVVKDGIYVYVVLGVVWFIFNRGNFLIICICWLDGFVCYNWNR